MSHWNQGEKEGARLSGWLAVLWVLWALCFFLGCDAHAAVWGTLRCTAPVGAVRYECERQFLGVRTLITLYDKPSAASGRPVPVAAGQTQEMSISVSEDLTIGARGGCGYRIRYATANAVSDWSNLVIMAVVPSGNYLDLAGKEWKQAWPNRWKPATKMIGFSRAYGDTTLYAPAAWPELLGKGPIVSADSLCR